MAKNKKVTGSAKDWADKWQLDKEEKETLAAFEDGSVILPSDQECLKQEAMTAANAFSRKTARLNIRISDDDLLLLKLKASQEGLPYQTLAASIIHKFVR